MVLYVTVRKNADVFSFSFLSFIESRLRVSRFKSILFRFFCPTLIRYVCCWLINSRLWGFFFSLKYSSIKEYANFRIINTIQLVISPLFLSAPLISCYKLRHYNSDIVVHFCLIPPQLKRLINLIPLFFWQLQNDRLGNFYFYWNNNKGIIIIIILIFIIIIMIIN